MIAHEPLTPEEEDLFRQSATHASGRCVELAPETPHGLALAVGLVLEGVPRLLATLDAARASSPDLATLAHVCPSCHHPAGYHVSDAGHPSGDMEPWCYCPSGFLRAALATPAAPSEAAAWWRR